MGRGGGTFTIGGGGGGRGRGRKRGPTTTDSVPTGPQRQFAFTEELNNNIENTFDIPPPGSGPNKLFTDIPTPPPPEFDNAVEVPKKPEYVPGLDQIGGPFSNLGDEFIQEDLNFKIPEKKHPMMLVHLYEMG